jgi:hypothetical protein
VTTSDPGPPALLDLRRLQGIHEATTRGRWLVDTDCRPDSLDRERATFVRVVVDGQSAALVADFADPSGVGIQDLDNAVFVTTAQQLLPRVLRELGAARAVVAAARLVGREDLDETDVAERLAETVADYDRAANQRPQDVATGPVEAKPERYASRYVDLADRDLAAALAADDAAEDLGLSPEDRRTCWTHRCWAWQCADDPMHADPTPGLAALRCAVPGGARPHTQGAAR